MTQTRTTEREINFTQTTDANGWVKRDYGNWQTYERTVPFSISVGAGSAAGIGTYSLPVGIADTSAVRIYISQVAGYLGRAFVGYDSNSSAATTGIVLQAYNTTGGTINPLAGNAYIKLVSV